MLCAYLRVRRSEDKFWAVVMDECIFVGQECIQIADLHSIGIDIICYLPQSNGHVNRFSPPRSAMASIGEWLLKQATASPVASAGKSHVDIPKS